jgi:hypothetical protein
MPTRVVQSYSKEVQFLPTCCEQRVTYLVIGISDLELESTFLEQRVSVQVRQEGFFAFPLKQGPCLSDPPITSELLRQAFGCG